MRKLLFLLLAVPMMAIASIRDWDYVPYISYDGQSPSEIIREGRNFDFLESLWGNPKSPETLKAEGWDFSGIDTALLLRQGIIYQDNGVLHSAIPFIDSVAMNKVRELARQMAQNIISETKPQREAFLSLLDSTGYSRSAFALTHSRVFDNLIWDHLGISQENATLHRADSMTWNGVFYFFRPSGVDTYGTNGMGLGDDHRFYFAWGDNSNAYLCTVFIKSNVLKGLKKILKGEEPSEEEIHDCRRFGFIDEDGNIVVPVLTGNDAISLGADEWARAAGESFDRNFNAESMISTIGLDAANEKAAAVILYHEVLFEIDRLLDESQMILIPSVLSDERPASISDTSQAAYIVMQ